MEYGSSYLPSELNAAHLLAQLEVADEVNKNRLATWNTYREQLEPLAEQGLLEFLQPPAECSHNAHMFAVKLKDLEERTAFTEFLKDRGIVVSFHYVPLHTSPAGQKFGRFHGEDVYTTRESQRLTRLPMFYEMDAETQGQVIDAIFAFFAQRK